MVLEPDPGGGPPPSWRDVHEADARWEAILATSSDAFVGADEHDRITDWNPAAEALFGWSTEEAVGRSLSGTLIPPEFRDRHHAGMERFLETGSEQVMFRPLEVPALHRTGQRIPVELRIWPAHVQGRFRFYAFLRDLTAEQQAEQHLRLLADVTEVANRSIQAEEAVRAALARICDLTGWPVGHAYLTDRDDKALLVPSGWWYGTGHARFAAATAELSFRAGEGLPGRVLAAGRPLWSDLDFGSFPRADVASADGLKSGFAFPVHTGSAVVAVLEFYTTVSVAADESLLELVHQVGTQIGRVFERQRAMEDLAAVADMRSRMMRILAHDVQTPLVSVRGYANLLAEHLGDATAEELRRYADGITRNADRLDRMVTTLLSGTRAEAGQLVATPADVPLRRALSEVVADLRVEGVRYDVASDLTARVDREHLLQIFTNLLSNAQRYGAPPIELHAGQADGEVVVTVSDHGPGLQPDLLDGLFAPFVRGRHHEGGTGLGLWISRELARSNGGDLRPMSATSGGACFELLLPAGDRR